MISAIEFFCELDCYRSAGEQAQRAELLYRALHLPDIALKVFGEEVDDVVIKVYIHIDRLLL